MISIVLGVVALIVAIYFGFKAKSKIIQFISFFVAAGIVFFLLAKIMPHRIEINDSSYLTIQEISAVIEHDQKPEAIELKSMIKTSLADNKIMLSEFNEIGAAYRLYRQKYPLNH